MKDHLRTLIYGLAWVYAAIVALLLFAAAGAAYGRVEEDLGPTLWWIGLAVISAAPLAAWWARTEETHRGQNDYGTPIWHPRSEHRIDDAPEYLFLGSGFLVFAVTALVEAYGS